MYHQGGQSGLWRRDGLGVGVVLLIRVGEVSAEAGGGDELRTIGKHDGGLTDL
jgi:hypothetical protein